MKPSTRSLAALGAGLGMGAVLGALGWALLVGHRSASGPGPRTDSSASEWVCSMHPHIRLPRFGRCPICGMDLTPVAAAPGADSAGAGQHACCLALGERARAMAGVATVAIEERELFKEIRTVGKVALDETRVRHIAARVDGRVDQVFADFQGTRVREGDHLVKIYSPDLLATQEEFLLGLRGEGATEAGSKAADARLSTSARSRLRLWGLTETQLDELARTRQAQTHVVVHAPIAGTVVEKNVREGQYLRQGDSLYTIADLGHVWLILEVYESELPWVRFGQSVQVALEGDPGLELAGTVGFIEPLLNESTRSVRVRVVLKNDEGRLRPGMYAQALLKVRVLADGKPGPTGLEGKHACPMHPYIVSEAEGACAVCGMPLELHPARPDLDPIRASARVLAVPAEAVLTTGRRWLVYVEDKVGEYRLVEPKLGPRAGDYYPVLSGLSAAQRVVARGNFLLDSQFQITGKPSLLHPEGIGGGQGAAPSAPAARPEGRSGQGAAEPEKIDPHAQHRH